LKKEGDSEAGHFLKLRAVVLNRGSRTPTGSREDFQGYLDGS